MSRRLIALATALSLLMANAPAENAVFHRPRVSNPDPAAVVTNAGWSSSNWSGYAITGSFTAVTGTWTVQAVAASKKPTYSSQWIGIDGFNNSNLIQTGTESDFTNGSAHYAAWWEILPAAETIITSVPVRAGDRMSAAVTKNSNGTWTISIKDNSTGGSFSTVKSYGGPGASAEWIEEAPTVGGRIAQLAHYSSPQTFDPGTVDGRSPGLRSSDGGEMVQGRQVVSIASNPDGDTDGFNMAYGSTPPSPPSS